MSPLATALVLMTVLATFFIFAWWVCDAECKRRGDRIVELLLVLERLTNPVTVFDALDDADLDDLRDANTPGDVRWLR